MKEKRLAKPGASKAGQSSQTPSYADRATAPVSGGSEAAVKLLELQQTLGNAQTMQLMGGPSATIRIRTQQPALKKSASGTVVQRVLSDIQLNPDQKSDTNVNNVAIVDVLIAGRTPSPFTGTMGAHSTAWVAHIDAVRRMLVGYMLDDGCKFLVQYAREQLQSPLLRMSNYLEQAHKEKLQEAYTKLNDEIGPTDQFKTEDNIKDSYAVLVQIQKLIGALLTFVNYMPMATVKGGDPRGNGEGNARELLNLTESAQSFGETIQDLDENDINYEADLKHYETLLNDIKKQNSSVNLKKAEALKAKVKLELRKLFAVETPGIFAQTYTGEPNPVKLCEVWAIGLQHYFDTVKLAYPYSFEFAEWHKEEIFYNEIELLLERQAALKQLDEKYKLPANKKVSDYLYLLLRGKQKFDKLTLLNDNQDEMQDSMAKQPEPAASAIGPSDYSSDTKGTFMSKIFLIEDGTIGDVIIKGRTPTPFSSQEGMGAHSTAWTAHVDAVRRSLTGKSLKKGAAALKELGRHALTSPAFTELKGQVGGKQLHNLKYSEQVLQYMMGQEGNYGNLQEGTSFLQQFIYHYMDFVNNTPLATVVTGSVPGGRNEGLHRQLLLSFEENKPIVDDNLEEQLQEALYGLFDPNSIDKFSPDSEKEGGKLDNLEGKKWFWALNTLLHTLQTAYPAAYKAANFEAYVVSKLEAPHEEKMLIEEHLSKKEQEKLDKKDADVQLNDLSEKEWIAHVMRAKSWTLGKVVRVHGEYGNVQAGILSGRLNETTLEPKLRKPIKSAF